MVLALVRGDHRLNEIKLRNALGADFRRRTPRRSRPSSGRPGSSARSARTCRSSRTSRSRAPATSRRQQARHAPDRRRARARLRHSRSSTSARSRRATSRPAATRSRSRPAIEVGNIFKLGHALLGAARRHLPRRGRHGAPDRDGQLRDRAGADRRRGDRAGRRRAGDRLAALAGRPVAGSSGRAWARPARRRSRRRRRLYEELASGRARTVVYDDREAGPGEKLTDAELLGCPLRLVVGKRDAGRRRGRGAASAAAAPTTASRSAEAARPRRRAPRRPRLRRRCPSKRRLFGIDRSGPTPSATRKGAPLHPRTIPNLVGYLRLAAIPVFLVPRAQLRRRPDGRAGDSSTWRSRRRLPRRLPRPGDRPVQPDGGAARPGRRPAHGPRRRRRLLEVRAAAAVGAGGARGARGGHAGRWPRSALRRGRRPRGQLGRADGPSG